MCARCVAEIISVLKDMSPAPLEMRREARAEVPELAALAPLEVLVPVAVRGAVTGCTRAVAVHGRIAPEREVERQIGRLHGGEGFSDGRALAGGVDDDATELRKAECVQLLGELFHEEVPDLIDLFRRTEALPRAGVRLRSDQVQEADHLVDLAGGEFGVGPQLASDQRHETLPHALFHEVLVGELAALALAGHDCGHQYLLPLEPGCAGWVDCIGYCKAFRPFSQYEAGLL